MLILQSIAGERIAGFQLVFPVFNYTFSKPNNLVNLLIYEIMVLLLWLIKKSLSERLGLAWYNLTCQKLV